MLKVHSIETFGTHEGPGIRLVVFLQGCNIRCLYCHNPDLLDIKGGQEMTVQEIIDIAKNQKEYFSNNGGITVSGGEPTLQAIDVLKLFKAAKKIGINTALDTNGTIINDDVKKLYNKTDLLLLDVKHIDDQEHQKLTGISNKNVLEMAKFRELSGKSMWLRYVLVPNINDSEKFLTDWAKYFKDYKTIQRVEILPYHTLGVYKYKELGMKYLLKNTPPPTASSISLAKSIFDKYFKKVVVK
jgi:pyruvate formate lyase activating enzyme